MSVDVQVKIKSLNHYMNRYILQRVLSDLASFPRSQELQEAAPVFELIVLPTQASHFFLSADRYFPAAHGSEKKPFNKNL